MPVAEKPDEAAVAEAAQSRLREGIARAKALVVKARQKISRAVSEPAKPRTGEPDHRN
jgi:hypothetical protein